MSVNGDVRVDPVNIRGDISVALRGEDGLSAYEVAVKNGFSGTEEEWLESLKGEAAKAEAYTNEAKEYWQNAQASAIQSGNSAVEAARYRNEAQDIRDAFAPEVADARAAIQAEKEEAEQKKMLVDDAAANAHLDREQADADAAEVRYLYNETIFQKNVATDAAERARLYAEGAGGSATAAAESAQEATAQAQAAEASAIASEHSATASSASATASAESAEESAASASAAAESASNAAQSERNIAGAEEATAASAASAASSAESAATSASEAHEEVQNVINSIDAAVDRELEIILPQQLAGKLDVDGKAVDSAHADNADDATHAGDADTVNGHTVETSVPPNAVFTDTTYEVMASSELEDGVSTQGRLIDAHTLATFILTIAADVVNNAPEALDTLAELAQALGNDPNFATTVMTEIGKKLDKAGGVVTGDLTVNGTLTGNVTGNAATATKLATARTINIQDSSATNTGTGASFDGSGNATIKLPATIKANITGNVSGSSGSCTGNAATAMKATNDSNGRNISTGYMWRGSYERIEGSASEKKDLNNYTNAGFYNVKTTNVNNCPAGIGIDAVLLVYPWNSGDFLTQELTESAASKDTRRWIRKLNSTTWSAWKQVAFTDSSISGNSATATKLATARTINIQDSSATNTGTGASFDGSGNATIKLPATIKANITGNCTGSSGSCTGNAATATKLATARTLWGASFDGSGNVSGNMSSVGSVTYSDTAADATRNLLYAKMGANDYFRVLVGGASNAGYAEIATADDGNEPIYVRQYSGTFATLTRTATLLDGSGNTTFPGKVTASGGLAGALTGNVTGSCSGSSGSCTGNSATASKAAQLTTARTIDGVSFNGTANITHYGSCSTAAATAAKTVACTGFTLATGARIEVKFTVTNTAANPTLNVNSTGAKAIYYRGAAISAGYLAANRTYGFVYNGTQYELVGDLDTNTNTDTLMTQNVSTANSTYPLLMCPTANATANQGAKTGIFSAKAVLNASNGQMKLNSKVVPVVSSFDSTTGVLALVSSGS